MPQVTLRQATSPADMEIVRTLCWEYRDYLINFSDELREAISFVYAEADYARLMASLEEKHKRPKGYIVLAELDDKPVGCGMTQALNDDDAEIKRVFVRQEARKLGVASRVSQALVDQARLDGYRRVLLDTSRQFIGAQRLYEKLGFKRRGPYSELPPGFEKYLVFYQYTL